MSRTKKLPTKRLADLVGQRFGWLTVLQYVKCKKKPCGNARWECLCDCGNRTVVRSNKLVGGNTISCGCQMGHPLPGDTASFNYIFRVYVGSAKQKKLRFEYNDTEFREITSKSCYYCGSAPTKEAQRNRSELGRGVKAFEVTYKYNGIDRVDSSLGYVKGNCVPCCTTCNYMKRSLSLDEFLLHVKKIVDYGERGGRVSS